MITNVFGVIPQNIGQPTSGSSGTGGLADSPWPMFRQNLNHTGVSPYDTSANMGKEKWNFTTRDYTRSSPAIGADGTIYIGSRDNRLYAINPDGSEKWSFISFGEIDSSPAIGADGTIYVGSMDYKLYAINPDSSQKWAFTTGNEVNSNPAIGSDGTIYVGSFDHNLYGINPDGTEKWRFGTGIVRSSPAIGSDGTIYVGSYDYNLYAINPDGTEKWNFPTSDKLSSSSPAIGSDGTIYVGSDDNKFYAINPDGTEKWNFPTGDIVRGSPAIGSDGTIYVGSDDGCLYAINQDGTEKWSFRIVERRLWYSSPAIGSDGTIYVGYDTNKVYAINPDGSEKWNFLTGDGVRSSPAIGSDGTIYIGCSDGKLYAIGTPNMPPIADAGPDQTVDEGETVYFEGTTTYHCIFQVLSDVIIITSTYSTGSGGRSFLIKNGGILYANGGGSNNYFVESGGSVVNSGGGSSNVYLKSGASFESTGGVGHRIYYEPGANIINPGNSPTLIPCPKMKFEGYDPDINIESYEWDFESDGTYDYQETQANAPDGAFDGITEHIYGDNGVFTVSLRVTDDDGENDTDTCSVTVNNLAPSITPFGPFTVNEGSPLTLSATCTDPGSDDLTLTWELELGPTITRTFYNDGVGPDPNPSPWGNFPFTVSDSISHTYGDDGTYSVTLTVVDDDGDIQTYSTSVTVNNLSPSGGISGIYFGDEGSSISFTASGTDPGSDDLTFSWNWGDGTPDNVNTFYNDGLGPDPSKSPGGIFPFSATDSVGHIYGDDADYTVTLTITDDDSYYVVYSTTVSVDNLAPTIVPFILEPVDEGTPISIMTMATDPGSDDLTFTWDYEYGPSISNIYYNDGTGPDPDPSPQGTYPFSASDTVGHIYGDDGEFSVTITVEDDDGGETSYTTTLEVNNVAPLLDLTGPSGVDENSLFDLDGHATDLGSDDLTFTWEFEFGPRIITTYYNNGVSPDPDPSPDVNPMDVLDNLAHIYGDNGVFTVTLTVEDDDGGVNAATIEITVNNVLPLIDFDNPLDVDENSPVTVSAIVSDDGSDDLIITWDWGDGISSTITTTHFNDGTGPDQFPSPDINPISVMESQIHTYGDNGVFTVTIIALDDDLGETIETVEVEVENVDPIIMDIQIYMYANISLRVAGEKYHSVAIRLYEDGSEIWTDTVTRYPGSPDEQKATISNVRLDMTKNYTSLVDYLPNDPRVNGNVWGGNPVWIDMEFEDGSTKRLHHTFNVKKSYWDSDHWNHIDPWEVDLNPQFVGLGFEITSHVTDPGSDDETLTYSYGSQIVTVTYLNNPPNPDPYPSPEVNPRDIMATTILVYEGPGTITLVVKDDDGGLVSVTLDIG